MISSQTRLAPQSLRVSVIGTGKISEEHLRFLSSCPGVALSGVCDLSPALARYATVRFNAAKAFTDYRKMLAEVSPDVVHVLTPPHTHVRVVSDCLAAGAHVIVEKPIAPTAAEAERLWLLADRNGRRLIENHNYRFNAPIRRMRDQVQAGRVGDVREVEVRMCLGIRAKGGRYADENLPHPSHALPAGVLHEFLTHMCYLVLCFVPRWDIVRAIWGNQGGGNLFKYDDLDALVLAHSARARIRFSCNQAPDCFTVVIRGSNGSLETDLFLPFVAANVPRRVGSQLSPLANQALGGGVLLRAGWTGFWNKVLQVTPYEGLQSFLAQTYAALANGDEPPVTREDSLAAARLVDALVAEAHTA